MCCVVVSQHDDSVQAILQAEYWSILLAPLLVRSPRIVLRSLVEIAYHGESWGSRGEFSFPERSGVAYKPCHEPGNKGTP